MYYKRRVQEGGPPPLLWETFASLIPKIKEKSRAFANARPNACFGLHGNQEEEQCLFCDPFGIECGLKIPKFNIVSSGKDKILNKKKWLHLLNSYLTAMLWTELNCICFELACMCEIGWKLKLKIVLS